MQLGRNDLKRCLDMEFSTQHGWPTTPQKFWAALHDVCSAKGKTFLQDMGRQRVGHTREYIVQFEELDACRAFWDQHMFKCEWPCGSRWGWNEKR